MRYKVVQAAQGLHLVAWVYRDGYQWLTAPMSLDEAEAIVKALNKLPMERCNAVLRALGGGYATCDLAMGHSGPHHGAAPA